MRSDEKALLACTVAVVGAIYVLPKLLHYAVHRLNLRVGEQRIWRRPSDNVQMVGTVCLYCGKLIDVHPLRISYKRMMRGEKWY